VIIARPMIGKMVDYDEDELSSQWIEQFNKDWLSKDGGIVLIDQLAIILKDRHRSSTIVQKILAAVLPTFRYSDDMYFLVREMI
jgi:hypothetical protein